MLGRSQPVSRRPKVLPVISRMPAVGSGRTMLALLPQILHRSWQCSRRLIDKFLLQRQYLQISHVSVAEGSAVECNKLGLHNAGGRAMELKGRGDRKERPAYLAGRPRRLIAAE